MTLKSINEIMRVLLWRKVAVESEIKEIHGYFDRRGYTVCGTDCYEKHGRDESGNLYKADAWDNDLEMQKRDLLKLEREDASLGTAIAEFDRIDWQSR